MGDVRRRGGDIKSVLSNVHKFVKDKRLVSSALRHFLPTSTLHKAAQTLGYGRRRRVRRRRGGDLKSVLSSAHKFIKDKRLVSSALRHFLPNSNLHKAAHAVGYGRRRTVRRRARNEDRHAKGNFLRDTDRQFGFSRKAMRERLHSCL